MAIKVTLLSIDISIICACGNEVIITDIHLDKEGNIAVTCDKCQEKFSGLLALQFVEPA